MQKRRSLFNLFFPKWDAPHGRGSMGRVGSDAVARAYVAVEIFASD